MILISICLTRIMTLRIVTQNKACSITLILLSNKEKHVLLCLFSREDDDLCLFYYFSKSGSNHG